MDRARSPSSEGILPPPDFARTGLEGAGVIEGAGRSLDTCGNAWLHKSAVPGIEDQERVDLLSAILLLVGLEEAPDFGTREELACPASGGPQGFGNEAGQVAAEPFINGNGKAFFRALRDSGRQHGLHVFTEQIF